MAKMADCFLAAAGVAVAAVACSGELPREPLSTSTEAISVNVRGGWASSIPGTSLPAVTVRPMPDAIRNELAAAKAASSSGNASGSTRSTPDPREATKLAVGLAAATEPDAEIRVMIELTDEPFDFEALQSADDAKRETIIAARKSQLAFSQSSLINDLHAIEARNVAAYWLANQVAFTVKAKHVTALASRLGVVNLHLVPEAHLGAGYGGYKARSAMRTDVFQSAGHNGTIGGRAGGRVRIAVIDAGFPARNHYGWELGGTTRLTTLDCRTGTCLGTVGTYNGNVLQSHANRVTKIVAGSIEQGQDVNFPGLFTPAQTSRSGQALGALLIYYEMDSGDDVLAAINHAVANGADVINMSLAVGGGVSMCNAGYNYFGSALMNALNSGTVPVACGGNNGSATCTAWYPGFRSESLGVNAVDTSDESYTYDTQPLQAAASKGGLQLTRWDGTTGSYFTTAGIDIAAPGDFSYHFGTGPNNYEYDTQGGCSFAAPAVSGATAMMKSSLASLGWTDSRLLIPMVMIGGDAWRGYRTNIGVDDLWGTGRLHLHWPSSTNLTAPWAWGWRTVTVTNGNEVCWTVGDAAAEPSTVRQWKWATSWYELNLQSVADIDARVYDTCAPEGRKVLYSDTGYDLRHFAQLRDSQVQGKCLQMCLYGYSVPPEGRLVWSTDFFHGGDPANF